MKIDSTMGLKAIAVLAAAGLLFSGYLSYNELFAGAAACGAPGGGLIFGLPACVYGFFMYLVVFIIAVVSLQGKKR